MNNGAIIFAQNNGLIDYIKLAKFSAERIQKYLNIPVSLITDMRTPTDNLEIFDKIIFTDNLNNAQIKKFNDGTLYSKKAEWKNFNRSQVFDLTPYNKTLVIDSDFIINSSALLPAFSIDSDFQIYQTSFDLASWRSSQEFQRINSYSIPFYWATAFVFEKTEITKSFFTLISHIKENWQYYRLLYSIETTVFRNDFAFSIAIHIMNNNTTGSFSTPLPGNMVYITDRDLLVSAKNDSMQFLVEKQAHLGEYTLVKTSGIDIHVMNKQSLQRFIDGGSGV